MKAAAPLEPASPASPASPARPVEAPDTYDWTVIPFFGVHVAAIAGVVALGFSWSGLALALGWYVLRMFGITAGYHRYFAHRGFKTGRVFQFVLALLGTAAVQKGVLWWAGHHRDHHRYSDGPEDVHSPRQRGFWYSHVGWILSHRWDATPYARIKDFARFPELMFLERYAIPLAVVQGVLWYVLGGMHGLVWGFLVSTTLLWHGTFAINSLAHVFGRRRYATKDDSRNSLLLALITLGEGWHNNHHYYPSTARNGFFWWELDVSYLALRALALVGVVWDLREPPRWVLANEPRKTQGHGAPDDVDAVEPEAPRALAA